MTWTLVQKSAAVAATSSGTVTGTLPGASTAGNLLVACLGSSVAGTQFTGPAGWVQGPQVGNGSLSRSEIWYYPSNPGGISSAAFVCGTGNVRAALAEFNSTVSGTLTVATATGTASATTTCTVSGTAAAGALMVCAFLEHLSPAVVTWTDPSGFTLLDSITTSNSNPVYSAYQLSAGGGSFTVTGTSNTTAGSSGWTGAVAAFTVASSQTVFYGATVNLPPYPAGTTTEQAYGLFAAATGRPVQVRKIYYQLSSFPVNSNGTVNLSVKDIDKMIAGGVKGLLSVKPSFTTLSAADKSNLATMLAAYKAAGLVAEVGYWQEPVGKSGPTPAQYAAAVQFYKDAITPYYPLVALLNYGGASGDPQGFTDYWNALPTGTFAKGYMDFYAQEWVAGATLDGAAAACDAQGAPFGIAEWNCNPSPGVQSQATCTNFMNYVINFMVARKNAGQPISDVVWYNNGPGPSSSSLAIAITNPPQPGCGTGSPASDFRIPLFQSGFDQLTSSGGGTVSLSAALQVVATAAGTATGGAVQVPSSNPGAAGPPGFPVLISEIGVVPTSPVPAPGTFLLSDPTFGLLNLDVLGGSTQWADISAFVKSFTITRTSTRQNAPVITYDPGTEASVLDNTDGRFDPDNLAGPYVAAGVTQVHPMTPKRTRVVWQGTAYPLFSGFADSWITPDTNYGPYTQEMNLSATDGFKVLSGFQLAAAAAAAAAPGGQEFPEGAGEDTGARVTRILDIAGWSNDDRSIDTGDSSLQATSLAGPDALSEMQLATDTELGELYVNGAGKVVFRRRQGVMEDTRSSVPQAVFGDNPGTGAVLNANGGFETGTTTGWTAQNGATVQVTGSGTYQGAFSGLFFGNGVTAAPQITTSPGAAVTQGQYVTFGAWLETAAGGPWQVSVAVQFFDGGGLHITGADAVSQIQASPGAWQMASAAAFAPAGAATVKGTVTMNGTPASSVQAGVDEAWLQVSPELPYAGLGRSNDDAQLCNDAQITSAGSNNLQEAQDAASIVRFLYPRSYQRSDLLLQSDAEALEWAQFIVYLSKGAEDRFDTITLSPLRDPRLWPHALGREIGDMIQVIRRPPGTAPITKQLIIRGITHTVAVSPASWQTQWILQDASRYSFLTLGDPVQGQLGSNALAY